MGVGAAGFVQSLFQFPMLIYALVLLVVIIFRPRGILGTYEFSLDRLLFDGRLAGRKRPRPGREAPTHDRYQTRCAQSGSTSALRSAA